MSDHPILFSAPMVLAILSNRKTMTRRVVKPQPACGCRYEMNGARSAACHLANKAWESKDFEHCYVPVRPTSASHLLPCPYGRPGDHLWVRESVRICGSSTDGEPLNDPPAWYMADGPCPSIENWPHFRPSIHMPRWASRITLEVTDVRVERLRSISADDVRAEGVELPVSASGCPEGMAAPLIRIPNPYKPPAKWTEDDFWMCEFSCLWDSINGKKFQWASNPWVWVIGFKRIEP